MSLRQARQDEICVRLENFQWVEGNANGKKGKEKWPLNEWPKQPWLAESPGAESSTLSRRRSGDQLAGRSPSRLSHKRCCAAVVKTITILICEVNDFIEKYSYLLGRGLQGKSWCHYLASLIAFRAKCQQLVIQLIDLGCHFFNKTEANLGLMVDQINKLFLPYRQDGAIAGGDY